MDVFAGWWKMPHPHEHYAIQGCICSLLAVAVEEMAAGLATRRRPRADTAKFGKRSFGPDPLGIVAQNDEHIGDGVGEYARRFHQREGLSTDQLFDDGFMLFDLGIESQSSVGQSA